MIRQHLQTYKPYKDCKQPNFDKVLSIIAISHQDMLPDERETVSHSLQQGDYSLKICKSCTSDY